MIYGTKRKFLSASYNTGIIISECTEHTGFSRVVSGLPAVRPDAHKR